MQRRANALETFNDPLLRKYFRSEDLFFDYYAELAQSLADAHFEKSRPFAVEVQEMIFESDALARCRWCSGATTTGRCARTACRWFVAIAGSTRQDAWWITPGKL